MKTIAVWYESKEEKTEEIKLDIHINFWKLENFWKKAEYFIDFGFMIDKVNSIKKIKIHFPIKNIKDEDLEDLGDKFDTNFTRAVFNEAYTASPNNKKIKYQKIKMKSL